MTNDSNKVRRELDELLRQVMDSFNTLGAEMTEYEYQCCKAVEKFFRLKAAEE